MTVRDCEIALRHRRAQAGSLRHEKSTTLSNAAAVRRLDPAVRAVH